jgi:hypothetical protein
MYSFIYLFGILPASRKMMEYTATIKSSLKTTLVSVSLAE